MKFDSLPWYRNIHKEIAKNWHAMNFKTLSDPKKHMSHYNDIESLRGLQGDSRRLWTKSIRVRLLMDVCTFELRIFKRLVEPYCKTILFLLNLIVSNQDDEFVLVSLNRKYSNQLTNHLFTIFYRRWISFQLLWPWIVQLFPKEPQSIWYICLNWFNYLYNVL